MSNQLTRSSKHGKKKKKHIEGKLSLGKGYRHEQEVERNTELMVFKTVEKEKALIWDLS